MRIVIIEDEKRARAAIRNLLMAVDLQTQIVGECADASEGIETIRRKLPDLAFVDIRMPGMNGLEMIRKLNLENIRTEYVIITGYSDFQYAKQGIDLGVAGYILKPVTYEDIQQVLTKVLGRVPVSQVPPSLRSPVSLPDLRELENRCENLLIRRSIRYIDQHLGLPCHLAQTARALMVSPEHLSRSFHEEMGMTFTDYVRLVKMDYAMTLLRKTSMKVQEISWKVGIENDKYFHNVFKETVGMTPKQYRTMAAPDREDRDDEPKPETPGGGAE